MNKTLICPACTDAQIMNGEVSESHECEGSASGVQSMVLSMHLLAQLLALHFAPDIATA
jgi:hypothetical protein